jgi:hypothetical protein
VQPAHEGQGRASSATPWLDVFCQGCGTSRAIDVRTVDRHPLASVGTLVLGLRVLVVSGISTDVLATVARHRSRLTQGFSLGRQPG